VAKSPQAFRTISEAAAEVGVPQHVLRFWETKFPFVAPVKRAGGRRFYRPQDIAVLQAIRGLLHDQGLTIKGVQKLHKDGGLRRIVGPETAEALEPSARPAPLGGQPGGHARLRQALADLEAARARLARALAG
jgi:DNA-binding transcriptional MerR regulator